MNLFKINIEENQRGFVFENGTFIKYLTPGLHKKLSNPKYEVIILDTRETFSIDNYDPIYFMNREELQNDLVFLDVEDHQIALHYKDDHFVDFLNAGLHVFWKTINHHRFTVIDKNEPEILDEKIQNVILKHGIDTQAFIITVEPYEKGLLFFNKVYERILEAGRYFFWYNNKEVAVEKVDTRIRELQVTGQEIMTEDKVPVRINFICQYNIINVEVPILQIQNYEQQLYLQLQMIIREYVGNMKLDDLLKNKKDMAEFVYDKLTAKEEQYGAKFAYAGLKDIILPGEIRDIINTVLIAEKKAHANVITRREETASTRSLLNTAKLMDENSTLYKLKELEYLEKICDKVGHISLNGNNNIIEQLSGLFNA
ncbi:MAG: slipin family protein [Clostridiales bacterium]|nr:slipin family protein [Clostridiales bacterium]